MKTLLSLIMMCVCFTSTLSSQISVEMDIDFCKRKLAGTYPHPLYCPGFYICQEDYTSETILSFCPTGLIYNEALNMCDFRENAPPPCGEMGPIDA
ncbi:chitin binding peritrophin-A domain-containing protein [Sphingobacterium spiritivorum]|uniref:chitin binding peritrophin-A domain-containing protein n=2 Tax=Sphingobacterium spiritivorum TaxID=258 RepID=UPI003DA636CF